MHENVVYTFKNLPSNKFSFSKFSLTPYHIAPHQITMPSVYLLCHVILERSNATNKIRRCPNICIFFPRKYIRCIVEKCALKRNNCQVNSVNSVPQASKESACRYTGTRYSWETMQHVFSTMADAICYTDLLLLST